MANIIELKSVELFYDKGTPTETHALQDINLEVHDGDFIGLFGPSGCGKSSMLYSISGIEMPTGGDLICDNKELRKLNVDELAVYRQTSVGIIFQNFNLIPSINIIDNVMLPMALMGIDWNERHEKAKRILSRLGMEKFAKRFAHELSGGQQQRVGIARALANDPPIILADEPVGSLDSVNANNVLDFLKELNEKDKRTIVLVTHEAWSLRDAHKVYYMKDGQITKTGGKVGPHGEHKQEEPDKPRRLTVETYRNVYPEYSEERLNAKALASLFLRGYRDEEFDRFEIFLENLLAEKINLEEFADLLYTPWRDGGLGLRRNQVNQITGMIGSAVKERTHLAQIYDKLEGDSSTPLNREVERLIGWMEKSSQVKFATVLKRRLGDAIKLRLRHDYSSADFAGFLNTPIKVGGMGLRLEKSRVIATKLDTILN